MTSASEEQEATEMGVRREGRSLGTVSPLQSHQAQAQEAPLRKGVVKIINGEPHKKCRGPLHEDGGAWMPLRKFWTHKGKHRRGKPFSQCIACERIRRGRGEVSGIVPVSRVFFIFEELEARVGRAEACRLTGISANLWYRLDNRIYKNMYKHTVYKAMIVLQELRDKGVVRHRLSIKHGASARGRIEREVKTWGDVYKPETEEGKRQRLAADAERKRKERQSAKTPV